MPINYRNKANFTAGAAIDEIFTAAESLTGKRYYSVAPGSIAGEVIAATGASNPAPIGVLQNAPGAATKAYVRIFGVTKLTGCAATCDIRNGRFIRSSSVGAAEVPASAGGGVIQGRWLSASVATNASGLATKAFVDCMSLGGVCAVSTS